MLTVDLLLRDDDLAGGGIVDRVDHVEEIGLRHLALSVKKTGAFLGAGNAFGAFLHDRIFEYWKYFVFN